MLCQRHLCVEALAEVPIKLTIKQMNFSFLHLKKKDGQIRYITLHEIIRRRSASAFVTSKSKSRGRTRNERHKVIAAKQVTWFRFLLRRSTESLNDILIATSLRKICVAAVFQSLSVEGS